MQETPTNVYKAASKSSGRMLLGFLRRELDVRRVNAFRAVLANAPKHRCRHRRKLLGAVLGGFQGFLQTRFVFGGGPNVLQ